MKQVLLAVAIAFVVTLIYMLLVTVLYGPPDLPMPHLPMSGKGWW